MCFPHLIAGKVWRKKKQKRKEGNENQKQHKYFWDLLLYQEQIKFDEQIINQLLICKRNGKSSSYLLYEINIANNPILKLSTTSRENKIITRFTHPILFLLVFHKLRMRNVVIPNLYTSKNKSYHPHIYQVKQHKKCLDMTKVFQTIMFSTQLLKICS